MNHESLKRSKNFSQDLQFYFNSKETQEKLVRIEKNYNLTAKSDDFRRLVSGVLEGEFHVDDFADVLEEKLGLDFKQALDIDTEVYEEIFYDKEKEIIANHETEKALKQERIKVKNEEIPETGKLRPEITEISEITEIDDQEIAKIKSAMPRTASGGVDYEQVATGILKELKFFSQEKILESRFRNIIMAFLKDIRDAIETREMLLRSVKIGGLGLTEEQAEKVIKTLKQESKAREITEIDERRINTNQFTNSTNHESEAKDKEIIPKGSIGTEIDRRPGGIERFREEIKKAEKRFKAPYLEPEEEVGAPKETLKLESAEGQQKHKIPAKDIGMIRPEMAKPRSGPRTVWVDDVHHPSLPVPRPRVDEIGKLRKLKSATSHSSLVTRGDDDDGGGGGPSDRWLVTGDKQSVKPQMESARLTSRLVGPIEEIREASLVDFRRWSTDPKEAAERLKEKIEVLEEESWEKKALAIRAWHESALHNLYVEIGRESLERGEPVGEVIQDRRAEGRETLTQAEFEAIADLNRELRF